ncbi:12234_t:CDS:1, partial [Racocetra fulgida]
DSNSANTDYEPSVNYESDDNYGSVDNYESVNNYESSFKKSEEEILVIDLTNQIHIHLLMIMRLLLLNQ